jgi:hypothetical protein
MEFSGKPLDEVLRIPGLVTVSFGKVYLCGKVMEVSPSLGKFCCFPIKNIFPLPHYRANLTQEQF